MFSICSLIFVNISLNSFCAGTLCSLRFATKVCQHAKNGVHCVYVLCVVFDAYVRIQICSRYYELYLIQCYAACVYCVYVVVYC